MLEKSHESSCATRQDFFFSWVESLYNSHPWAELTDHCKVVAIEGRFQCESKVHVCREWCMVETKNPGHCKEVAISEAGGLTVFRLSVTISSIGTKSQ